jgi:hypothetical protein
MLCYTRGYEGAEIDSFELLFAARDAGDANY